LNEQQVKSVNYKVTKTLNVSSLTSGVYFISVYLDKTIIANEKLIICK